jgi:hypothetical protein
MTGTSAKQIDGNQTSRRTILFVCEKYYLRFYAAIANRLADRGFVPVLVPLDGPSRWPFEFIDPRPLAERLAEGREWQCEAHADALCTFERKVFATPDLFRDNYSYTVNVVRTFDRARRLSEAWFHLTQALLRRFRPAAVLLWNGRYLPYSAVSHACRAAEQLFLTSEIGWIPGTIFLDRGVLSPGTMDLRGGTFETVELDRDRADRFLHDYTARRATMVSQAIVPAAQLRARLLGPDGTFVLLYGCQVDWDTNVVIGASRFHSNEAAVEFLIAAVARVPGVRLVVKTHPLDTDTREDRFRAILGDRGIVVSDVHPHVLIEAADCVAVRNSTLGFEALCYGKPVLALEQAKYRHPALTLDAPTIEDAAAHLASISDGSCRVPDTDTLRRFVLHLLDHYLVPGEYEYHFEPANLGLLAHLRQNDSASSLELLLRQAAAPNPPQDAFVQRALDALPLRRTAQGSFLRRQVRKAAGWLRDG